VASTLAVTSPVTAIPSSNWGDVRKVDVYRIPGEGIYSTSINSIH